MRPRHDSNKAGTITRWLRLPRRRVWPLRFSELPPIPPGEHIQDALDERDWDTPRLADEIGMCERDTEALLQGRLRIESKLADRIAQVIGGTAVYWLNLQDIYDDAV